MPAYQQRRGLDERLEKEEATEKRNFGEELGRTNIHINKPAVRTTTNCNVENRNRVTAYKRITS
jgi:hypothetical protein